MWNDLECWGDLYRVLQKAAHHEATKGVDRQAGIPAPELLEREWEFQVMPLGARDVEGIGGPTIISSITHHRPTGAFRWHGLRIHPHEQVLFLLRSDDLTYEEQEEIDYKRSERDDSGSPTY